MEDGNGNTYNGMVWIEETTGVPLYITAGMPKLPRLVTEFSLAFSFTRDPERWYATNGVMTGSATIVIVKRRYRVTMQFQDYFRHPGENEG